jgi:hypothetical protein
VLNVDADVVVGYWLKNTPAMDSRHAWIVFRRENGEFCSRRDKGEMIRPLAEMRDDYLPQSGVDRSGRRFSFYAYTRSQKRLLERRHSRRTA